MSAQHDVLRRMLAATGRADLIVSTPSLERSALDAVAAYREEHGVTLAVSGRCHDDDGVVFVSVTVA